VLALAVGVAGTGGTLIAAREAIDTVQRVEGVGDVLSPPGSPVENFLLVGSDSRAGSDPSSPDYGGIGSEADVSGTRSDTIMVLSRDRSSGEAALLSIPRDLYVDIAGERGPGRINGAYNDGPAVLVQTVQQELDLPIHHYVEIDFSGFKSLVDAIGGVELCFFYPTRDVNTGLNVPEGGCHVMDGVQALAYARSRKHEQFIDGDWRLDGTADLGRTVRQQDFVNRALRTALDEVTSNPFRAGDVLRAGGGALRIDGELDVLSAAGSLRTAVGGGLATVALPVVGDEVGGASVLRLADGAQDVLAAFRGDVDLPAADAPAA